LSTTDGRRERIQRLLKCLRQHPRGLETHEIAGKTDLLTEITMDRLHKYLAELEWAGTIQQTDLRWTMAKPSLHGKREREKNKKRQRKKVDEHE
jgi:DNA-binding IclR family transcriptional regulator